MSRCATTDGGLGGPNPCSLGKRLSAIFVKKFNFSRGGWRYSAFWAFSFIHTNISCINHLSDVHFYKKNYA